MSELSNSVLSAVDIVVTDKINKIKRDTTIQATITDISRADKGHYKVKYENAIYDVYTDAIDTKYSVGESVYITVPEGDKSNKMFILGRVKEKEQNPYIETTDINTLYNIVEPAIANVKNRVLQVPAWAGSKVREDFFDEEDFSSNKEDFSVLLEPNLNAYSQLYEYIQISADFKYAPYYQVANKENKLEENKIETNGNYGLEIIFEDIAGQSVSYVYDVEDMYGSPFTQHDYLNRTFTLKVEKGYLKKLKEIRLAAAGFKRTGQVYHNPEIFVKNIKISFAEQISESEIYSATILTPYGIFASNGEIGSAQTRYLLLKSQLKYKGTVIDADKYSVEWFERDSTIDTANANYRASGGRGWKYLGDGSEYRVEWSYANNTDLPGWYHKDIKMVITYDKDIVRKREITLHRAPNLSQYYTIVYDKDFQNNIILKIQQATEDETTEKITYTDITDTNYTFDWSYTDINGQLHQNQRKTSSIVIPGNNILSDRTYTCALYFNGVLIDIQHYLISTKKLDALFNVEFITDNNGNFIYGENGYIESTEWEKSRELNFVLLWSGTPEPYKYRWILNEDEEEDLIVTTSADKNEYTPDNSMVTYQLSSKLIGSGNYDDDPNQPSLHYKINPYYNKAYSNNKVKLEITINDIKYYYYFYFTFVKQGDIGTNGTDYQMRVIQDEDDGNITWSKIEEVDENNQPIYKYNCIKDNTKYQIEIYKNGIKQDNAEVSANCSIRLLETGLNKNMLAVYDANNKKYSLAAESKIDSDGILTLKANGNNPIENSLFNNFVVIEYQPTKTVDSEQAYKLTYILSVQLNIGSQTIGFDNFPTILYDQAGYNPTYYRDDLADFYTDTSDGKTTVKSIDLVSNNTLYSINMNPPTKMEKIPTPILTETGEYLTRKITVDNKEILYYAYQGITTKQNKYIIYYEHNGAFDYKAEANGENVGAETANENSVVEISDITYENCKYQINEDGEEISTYHSVIIADKPNVYTLRANEKYDQTKAFDCLKVTNNDGNIIYVPLLAILNQYSLVNINGWDGNSVVVDKKGGYIYAPQIAAGNKNNDNTFNGVVMGEYVVDGDSKKTTLGLWGFYDGESTFGMNAENGATYFGKSGEYRIEINPKDNAGYIESGNYSETNKTGMRIDFANGNIIAPSFSLKSDDGAGQFLFELPTDTSNQSYFKIQAPNTSRVLNDVFYIGANDYYLQSVDYSKGIVDDPETDEDEGKSPTGLRIDLKNSFINAPGFTINGNGVGNIFNFNLDKSASFSITKNNGVNIFYAHGTSGYYLRSTNYTTAENDENVTLTGLNIDLDYGYISSPYFTISGNGDAWFSGSITASEITGTFTGTLNATGGRIGDGWVFSGNSLYAVKEIQIQTPITLTDDIIENDYKDPITGYAVYKSATDGKYYYDNVAKIITTQFDGNTGNITIDGTLTSKGGNVELNGIVIRKEEDTVTEDALSGAIELGSETGSITTLSLKGKPLGADGLPIEQADNTAGAFSLVAPKGISLYSSNGNVWISGGSDKKNKLTITATEATLAHGTASITIQGGQVTINPGIIAVFGE